MSKLKKVLSLVLVVALTAGVAITGTMAYLKDDDSDVNVMTLGNVQIAQHEYQRVEENGTYKTDTIDNQTSYVLEEFKQEKPLLPIVGDPSESGAAYAGWDENVVRMTQVDSYGSMQVFAGKNAQDKFVTVENTGKTDAYVRTLVAIEVGSTNGSLIGTSCHKTWTKNDELGIIEIGGNKYMVIEYVYGGGQLSDGSWRHENGILPAGDTTYPNLSQVYLKSVATNEDMVAIDGNKNGKLDILVLSQAVQADGFANAVAAFNAAFPYDENNANVPGWFAEDGESPVPKNEVHVNSVEELTTALDGYNAITVEENNLEAANLTVTAGSNVTVDLNGNTLEAEAYIENHGVAKIENGTLNSGSATNYGVISEAGSKTTLDNVELVSAGGGIGAVDGAQVVFNSGSVDVSTTSTSGRYNVYAEGEGTVVTINGGEFSFSKTLNQKRAYIYAGKGATVYVNGGNFGPASTRSGYTEGILGDGKIVITGGTFGFDPSDWVADGYQAVKNGTTWTVSVNN